MKLPDIDIDFADRQAVIEALTPVQAMVEKDGKKTAHPSGCYLQLAPIDPFTKLCSFDYKRAEELGYYKFDFLNQSVYGAVKDEEHLICLLEEDPAWELLEEPVFVEQLPHIHQHFDVVNAIRPKSIADLAVVLALIRPGKRHLLGKSRAEIDAEIWNLKEADGYVFKKAHATSYAALIVVRMNLLTAELLAAL